MSGKTINTQVKCYFAICAASMPNSIMIFIKMFTFANMISGLTFFHIRDYNAIGFYFFSCSYAV